MTPDFLWLSGWSVPADVWKKQISFWKDYNHTAIDFNHCKTTAEIKNTAVHALNKLSNPAYIIGWSLGAMVTLELVHLYPDNVKAIFLIGGTPQFVKDKHNSFGWDIRILNLMKKKLNTHKKEVISSFDQQIFSNTEICSKWENFIRKQLPSTETLVAGLDYLSQFEFRDTISLPAFLLTGDKDLICPPIAAENLAKFLPNNTSTIWKDTCHIPFWTKPDRFHRWMKGRIAIE